ncbi:hypothetical protein BH24BAC1_BH24BAC1_40620 [soil metagenome]
MVGSPLMEPGKAREASLFSVKALSTVFKNRFCDELKGLKKQLRLSYGITAENFSGFLSQLRKKEWVVNSKPGFRGKESVLEVSGQVYP